MRRETVEVEGKPATVGKTTATPVARVAKKWLTIGPLAVFTASARPTRVEVVDGNGALRSILIRDRDSQIRLGIRILGTLAVLLLQIRRRRGR